MSPGEHRELLSASGPQEPPQPCSCRLSPNAKVSLPSKQGYQSDPLTSQDSHTAQCTQVSEAVYSTPTSARAWNGLQHQPAVQSSWFCAITIPSPETSPGMSSAHTGLHHPMVALSSV